MNFSNLISLFQIIFFNFPTFIITINYFVEQTVFIINFWHYFNYFKVISFHKVDEIYFFQFKKVLFINYEKFIG